MSMAMKQAFALLYMSNHPANNLKMILDRMIVEEYATIYCWINT